MPIARDCFIAVLALLLNLCLIMEIDETVLSSSPKLDLLIIAYRPSQLEVEALFACIQKLSPFIRYSIALNAAILEIENLLTPLFENALIVQRNSDNIGYGRAANNLFLAINQPAPGLRCSTPICIGSQAALKLCWVGLHPSTMWLQLFPRSLVPRGKWNV